MSADEMTPIDLSVNIAGVKLANPLMTASGTCGYSTEYADFVDLRRLGAFVTKSITLAPRIGNDHQRVVETRAGMLNAIGLANVGLEVFLKEKVPQLETLGLPVFVNVAGTTVEDYVAVAEAMEGVKVVRGVELNISCPNVERGGIEYSTDPVQINEVVSAARKVAKRPLWVKLSPSVGIIGLTAKAAESAGADAVVVANTYPALCLDSHTRKSRLGSTTGGLSGPAIRPITMRLVYEASRVIEIPIIGLGGIESPTDVAEYMVAGASATEVGTAHFVDPRASERLVGELEMWCRDENLLEISKLRGSLKV